MSRYHPLSTRVTDAPIGAIAAPGRGASAFAIFHAPATHPTTARQRCLATFGPQRLSAGIIGAGGWRRPHHGVLLIEPGSRVLIVSSALSLSALLALLLLPKKPAEP